MRKSPFSLRFDQQRDRVYLLAELENGSPTGLYKIGKTRSTTASRKRQYQAGNPRQVIIAHEAFVLPNSAQAIETALQHQWAQYHENNGGGDEWYRFPAEVIPDVIASFDQYHIDIHSSTTPAINATSRFPLPPAQPSRPVAQTTLQPHKLPLIQAVPPTTSTLPVYLLQIEPLRYTKPQRNATLVRLLLILSIVLLTLVFLL
ncbi:GIY-YIG nuclease family protein [Leptolyngbya sp. AN03gr2]|uniref:GIY-YIG nuclease family protein n=1 Tax=unclassified Leptolyngbya TaxID=2650499 RepID=UPI003D3183F1